MIDPTREMIVAGVRKLDELKRCSLPDDVLVEAMWFAMNEARTGREQIGAGYFPRPPLDLDPV